MGATSVTGAGAGDAGLTRGPGNNRNQYFPMIDPHVVWAGNVTLDQGAATVTLPSTIHVLPEYITCVCAGKGAMVIKLVDADGYVTGFGVLGYYAQSAIIDYLVLASTSPVFGPIVLSP